MLTDIIENTQLFVLGAWNSVVDAVAPTPGKREAIRVGMNQLSTARAKYRELDNMLRQEENQLKVTHVEERKLLAEKQKVETDSMRARHSATRGQAKETVRQVRSAVLSDILGFSTPVVQQQVQAPSRKPSQARKAPKMVVVPV